MTTGRHPRATTDEAVRRAIQASGEPATVLARRYGINRKTVQKWRARDATADLPRGRPQARVSTALTKEEEAIIIGFRKSTMLPLDDLLYAMQPKIPTLTRAKDAPPGLVPVGRLSLLALRK